MTAAVLVTPLSIVDPSSSSSMPLSIANTPVSANPAEARKRRREILASQRSMSPDTALSSCPPCTEPTTKKTKVSSDVHVVPSVISSSAIVAPLQASSSEVSKSKAGKKTQMKYDPEVPMTKEEAAAWRREQRRKRNRESAAASRQRQRDRINELEQEVADMKRKFEEAQAQIAALERLKAFRSTQEVLVDSVQSVELPTEVLSRAASPELFDSSFTCITSRTDTPEPFDSSFTCITSRTDTPEPFDSSFTCITPRASPTTCASLDPACEVFGNGTGIVSSCGWEGYVEPLQPPNLISRPAVKIEGLQDVSPSLPVLPDVAHSSIPSSDPYMSDVLKVEDSLDDSALDILLDPTLDTILPDVEESADDLLPPLSENPEDEFEDFLMDAMGLA